MGTYLHLFDEEEEQTAHINSAQYREPYFAGVNATYKAHYNHYNYKKVNFDTYKPMHYVENPSNGKGYIKTDYYPNNNTRLIIKAQINIKNSSGAYQFLFEAHKTYASTMFRLCIPRDTVQFSYGFGNDKRISQDNIITNGGIYTIELSQEGLFLDNEIVFKTPQQNEFTCPNVLLLGCGYENNSTTAIGSSFMIAHKLYYCKIYESGVLVRDYVPVKRISDNKYGVYDQVNNKFIAPTNANYTGG